MARGRDRRLTPSIMPDHCAEADLIEILRQTVRVTRDDVRLGVGDDAAVLAPPPGLDLAMATDTLVAGVHFPEATRAADVGWKSLAVNLSDLAAMGAEPAWMLLSLTLPEPDRDWVRDFAAGLGELAGRFGVALVGGDTTGGPLSVTLQATGFVEPGRVLRRDGARDGDGVYVTGTLGDAAAGLAIVRGNLAAGDASRALRDRLDRPTPRVAAGRALVGVASACIDLSDGLALDLGRILAASGRGARLALDDLPASQALRAAVPDPDRRRDFQLAGDDYELCFTASPRHHEELARIAADLGLAITCVGEITADAGMTLTEQGKPVPVTGSGWRHFGDGHA